MNISLVVAVTDNNVIGKNGKRGFYLYADMMFFKDLIKTDPIIMGSGTFRHFKNPLPGKPNIVLSKDKNYAPKGALVACSINEALLLAKSFKPKEIFFIGGQGVFDQVINIADRIYLTRVHTRIDGDRFFNYDLSQWQQVSSEVHQKDDKNAYDYDFLILERK